MSTDRHFSAPPTRRTRPPKRKTRITIYLDDEVLSAFRLLSERSGTGSRNNAPQAAPGLGE